MTVDKQIYEGIRVEKILAVPRQEFHAEMTHKKATEIIKKYKEEK